ncbi:MAG TPA: hydantoinase B/oxoprolinase family protein, partial [Candidatus Dormibacteraeota bacterium]|nr:hydantoinase B/oxoprolinase family protein [Candidatus Dormibacteraeota bacterium]
MSEGRVDPITLGVVWGALQSIAVEIGSSVQRTAYSIQAREGQDFSVAVFDAQGRMTAQGPYSPGHMGAMNFAIRNVLEAFPAETMRPGDVVLLNDPMLGSGHFPDFLLTRPCFWRDRLVGFAVNLVHHTDVGGSRPGSQAVEGIFDYHQEGLRIPPIKLVEAGVENAAALAIIAANSRTPRNVLGDLRSQRASVALGEQRIAGLYERFGPEVVEA